MGTLWIELSLERIVTLASLPFDIRVFFNWQLEKAPGTTG